MPGCTAQRCRHPGRWEYDESEVAWVFHASYAHYHSIEIRICKYHKGALAAMTNARLVRHYRSCITLGKPAPRAFPRRLTDKKRQTTMLLTAWLTLLFQRPGIAGHWETRSSPSIPYICKMLRGIALRQLSAVNRLPFT